MIIVLIGYMGSGKSSIGKMLSESLNYGFLDLDDYIEEKEGFSVGDIFKTKGEVYFRKKEAFYLKKLLQEDSNFILSVGGGTPCYGNNMEYIMRVAHVKSIYLKASISTLAKKLIKKKAKRPLISHIETEDAMVEFVGKHLFERIHFYNKAEIIIHTDDKTKKSIVEDILFKLF